jgi:protein tyrosine phosphatase (PTP) superfamily phosphohydrolase (DUF442 family)
MALPAEGSRVPVDRESPERPRRRRHRRLALRLLLGVAVVVGGTHLTIALVSLGLQAAGPGQAVVAGVDTIIDLRAEDDLGVDDAALAELGVERVAIPVRDGQVPPRRDLERFLASVDASDGPVFVHCGAGVGRTGAVVAAYLGRQGVSGTTIVERNLAVGPPSVEQLAFAAEGGDHRPASAVVAVSRMIDSPRRAWVRVTDWLS